MSEAGVRSRNPERQLRGISGNEKHMTDKPFRYVGDPDFHDGYIRAVSHMGNSVLVSIEGASGQQYDVNFNGVTSMESSTSEGMMLYALAERDTEDATLRQYEFVNWYFDEPDEEASKSFLRITASSFSVKSAES
jgi:hypothetical protein